jgi:hypothetical protein
LRNWFLNLLFWICVKWIWLVASVEGWRLKVEGWRLKVEGFSRFPRKVKKTKETKDFVSGLFDESDGDDPVSPSSLAGWPAHVKISKWLFIFIKNTLIFGLNHIVEWNFRAEISMIGCPSNGKRSIDFRDSKIVQPWTT